MDNETLAGNSLLPASCRSWAGAVPVLVENDGTNSDRQIAADDHQIGGDSSYGCVCIMKLDKALVVLSSL